MYLIHPNPLIYFVVITSIRQVDVTRQYVYIIETQK